jgi:hypothetical protein
MGQEKVDRLTMRGEQATQGFKIATMKTILTSVLAPHTLTVWSLLPLGLSSGSE